MQGNQEFKTAIQFDQNILIRHKISNKYLSYSSNFEDEENDTTVRLELSQKKCQFKILPCFQYQTKISNKVKFTEDVYLATQLNSAKLGFLSVRQGEKSKTLKTLIGLNYKTKVTFSSYYQRDKDYNGYVYGQAIWLTHVQSRTFLTVLKNQQAMNKQQIMFERIEPEQNLQSINGLWIIEMLGAQSGGEIHFNDTFRLKSMSSNRYLAFSKDYKLIQNQRIYTMITEKATTQQSKFIFQSLKGQQNKIKQGAYLIFRHQQSQQFIGTRRPVGQRHPKHQLSLNLTDFQDQDLFQIKPLQPQVEEAIRFIFSARRQFRLIRQRLSNSAPLDNKTLQLYQILFTNTLIELNKLQKLQQFFKQVQQQLGPHIGQLCLQLQEYRIRKQQKLIVLTKLIYKLLSIIIKGHKVNQNNGYTQLNILVKDLFRGVGAQQLISEIFRNNYTLLCKLPNNLKQLNDQNLVRVVFQSVEMNENQQKQPHYWQKIQSTLDLLQVLLEYQGSKIDVNQRLIAIQLLGKGALTRILFDLKVSNQRIRIFHPNFKKWIQIQQLTQQALKKAVERLISLVASLCQDRNFVSKRLVHQKFVEGSRDGIQTLISYLNIPLSKSLTNNILHLITNCYVDSSPRLHRHRPLAVIKFILKKQEISSKLSAEQILMSDRLKQNLLDQAQKSYYSRPLNKPSVIIQNKGLQPSLNSQQLQLFKQELSQRLREGDWSRDMLNSVCILLKLQSYNVEQIQEIQLMITNRITQNKLQTNIILQAMQILSQINIYCQQVQLKKVTTYLKYKFQINKDNVNLNSEISYLLPCSPEIKDQIHNSIYIQEYSNYQIILKKLYPSQKLIQNLIEMYVNQKQSHSYNVLSSIFNLIGRFIKPKSYITRLLSSCIIITEEDMGTFQLLNSYYKKLRHLVAISEHWLCGDVQQPEVNQFIQTVTRLDGFIFDQNALNETHISKKIGERDINRQLLLNNLAVDNVLLEVLKTNYYLLQGKTRKDLPKKLKQIFQLVFQFLVDFGSGCQNNIKALSLQLQHLQPFKKLLEVGQTKLLILLYREDDSLSRQLNPLTIEKALNKIIKGKNNDQCEFNPEYVQFLLTVIQIDQNISKRNIQIINREIQRLDLLSRLLFQQKKEGQWKLNLDLYKFKTQPLQVPFIYHKLILDLIAKLIIHLEAAGNPLKNKLKQYIPVEQVMLFLAQPDIFTHTGIIPQLNFLIKDPLLKILSLYLDKNDAIAKLHDSQQLKALLSHWVKIFINQRQKRIIQQQNQYLFTPFLKKYRLQLDYQRKNLRDYYQIQIKPFIDKFYNVFEKVTHKDAGSIFNLILPLVQINPASLTHDHLDKIVPSGLDSVSLKWRNFVDADQDNSNEQKFAKRAVLQLLRHDKTYAQLQKQQQSSFRILKKYQKQFVKITGKLIDTASEQGQDQEMLLSFIGIIQSLADYFIWTKNIKQQKDWECNELIEILIGFVTKQTFNYSNPLARLSLYQILRIFNFLLEVDKEQALVKHFYKIFHENISCFRLFVTLKDAISEVGDRGEDDRSQAQINFALSGLYLCGQQRKVQIDKQALYFIGHLCKYLPFTQFLRDQPYPTSVDFLDKIYNTFYFLIKNRQKSLLQLSVRVVDISEIIIETMLKMLNGCNFDNQNFIIDNKYPDLVIQSLKMQKIPDLRNKGELAKRDRLLQQVVQFYKSNGIDVSQILQQKIKINDFKGPYLLNRFKYSLFKLLLQCTIANQRVISKIKILIPIQLLKINLIWIYKDYQAAGQQFTQQVVLKQKQDWSQVLVENKKNQLFLMVGFYFYQLIQMNTQQQKEGGEDDEVANDQQKQKQKIVKKFFTSISDRDKKKSKQQQLQKQPFAEQMKMFYNQYYQAYQFFKSNSLTIQANIFEHLIKIYFPKIPLCDKFTQKYQKDFIQRAQRISHEQKIKSLIQYQSQAYQLLQGQNDYMKQLSQEYPLISKIVDLVRDEQQIYLIIWIVSSLIIPIYLLADFQNPDPFFISSLTSFIIPTTFLQLCNTILSIGNLCLAIILIIYLIFKKIPFLMIFQKQQYLKQIQEQKQRGKITEQDNLQQGLFSFQISKILPALFFNFYMIIFSGLSILHPLFSSFLSVYIIYRIAMGRQISIAIQQTWGSLFVATGLLIVFNYIFSILIYVATFTNDIGYGVTCQQLSRCLLLLVDQSLKAGTGFLGVVDIDYVNLTLTIKLLCEITQILFAQKVVFQIFSGTIIDKFSQLREKEQATQEDEQSNCYICQQQRFQIDFQLQGFQQHIEQTHNKFNYVFYLFYLRRKNIREYGIEEDYVWNCHENDIHSWIPNQTSLLKQQKELEEEKDKQQAQQLDHEKYYEKKNQQLKKIKLKLQNLNTQFKQNQSI